MLAQTVLCTLLFALTGLSKPIENGQLPLSLKGFDDLPDHPVDAAIFAALEQHDDPVDALLAIQPELAASMAEPRLLEIVGQSTPLWVTEGDKLRLRREGKKFIDMTDHQDAFVSAGLLAGDPRRFRAHCYLLMWLTSNRRPTQPHPASLGPAMLR